MIRATRPAPGELERATYYRLTQQQLHEAIASGLEFAAQLRANMTAAQAYLAQLPDVARLCPLCGGPLRDMKRLIKALDYFDDLTSLEADRMTRQRVPDDDECQQCGAFVTQAPEPGPGVQIWTRDAHQRRPSRQSLAALVFEQVPAVIEIACESRRSSGPLRSWLLRVQVGWYCLKGSKEEVADRLGLSAPGG